MYLVTLHEGCKYEGCWLVKSWLFDDFKIVEQFITTYQLEKQPIIENKNYLIDERYSDIQLLRYEKIDLYKEIPKLVDDDSNLFHRYTTN